MPYIVIDGFKLGMVRYGLPATTPPGALYEAVNGHINQGGEFKAREDIRLLERYDGGTGATTSFFGLIATSDDKLFTFGSENY